MSKVTICVELTPSRKLTEAEIQYVKESVIGGAEAGLGQLLGFKYEGSKVEIKK